MNKKKSNCINFSKIYFCFPYKSVGGVSVLFLRLAYSLFEKYNFKCTLIDYRDGYMSKNANLDKVDIDFYDDSKKTIIDKDSIIIFQSMTPWSIFPNLVIDKSTKVFFWTCHPFNFIPSHYGTKFIMNFLLNSYKKKSQRFVKYLDNSKGLVFMDNECLHTTEAMLKMKINDPQYLSIPSSHTNLVKNMQHSNENNKDLHLTWIGRIVDFKYNILIKLIEDLDDVCKKNHLKIKLTIIGEGELLKKLLYEIHKISSYKIEHINYLREESISKMLINETDILFAMGTSALDGAKFGTPTVLMDIAYKKVGKNYTYKWLFERDGRTLGENIEKIEYISHGADSLEYLIKNFISDKTFYHTMTLKYFKKNHDINTISDDLVKVINKANSSWGDILDQGYLKRGLIYPMIKNYRSIFKI
tara:strand:+ start:354 stop:1598 length:1245 start_codon:yes stop_codon:yes gene_type:complete